MKPTINDCVQSLSSWTHSKKPDSSACPPSQRKSSRSLKKYGASLEIAKSSSDSLRENIQCMTLVRPGLIAWLFSLASDRYCGPHLPGCCRSRDTLLGGRRM